MIYDFRKLISKYTDEKKKDLLLHLSLELEDCKEIFLGYSDKEYVKMDYDRKSPDYQNQEIFECEIKKYKGKFFGHLINQDKAPIVADTAEEIKEEIQRLYNICFESNLNDYIDELKAELENTFDKISDIHIKYAYYIGRNNFHVKLGDFELLLNYNHLNLDYILEIHDMLCEIKSDLNIRSNIKFEQVFSTSLIKIGSDIIKLHPSTCQTENVVNKFKIIHELKSTIASLTDNNENFQIDDTYFNYKAGQAIINCKIKLSIQPVDEMAKQIIQDYNDEYPK